VAAVVATNHALVAMVVPVAVLAVVLALVPVGLVCRITTVAIRLPSRVPVAAVAVLAQPVAMVSA
jgi:hypothetical protein